MLIIKYPKIVSGKPLSALLSKIYNFSQKKIIEPKEIFFDASDIEFANVEGVNYILLLPILMKESGFKIRFFLPKSNNVRRFLERLEIIDFLSNNFEIIDDKKNDETNTYINAINTTYINNIKLIPTNYATYISNPNNIEDFYTLKPFKYLIHKILDSKTSNRLATCILELAMNTFDHSGQLTGCITYLFQKNRFENNGGWLQVAVSDIGIGIKKSLGKDLGLPPDIDEKACLEWVIKPGNSRYGLNQNRGFGLPIVIERADKIRISSGKASILINNQVGKKKLLDIEPIVGTSILLTYNIH